MGQKTSINPAEEKKHIKKCFFSPKVSIGIPIYNESENIDNLVDNILVQKGLDICQIFFIASGCTDNSVEVIKRYLKKNIHFQLIEEEQRNGKAAAVNLFLKQAKGDVCIILSSDIMLGKNCLAYLIESFKQKTVGMAGVHAVPMCANNGFVCLLNKVLWGLNNQLSMVAPKLGEAVAFRNIIKKIPQDTAVDEANIEAFFVSKGYKLYYVDKALVFNKCPLTLKSLFSQRLRIYWGHIVTKFNTGYQVSSMDLLTVAKAVFAYTKGNLRLLPILLFLCFLEAASRIVACYKYYFQKRIPLSVWPEYKKG